MAKNDQPQKARRKRRSRPGRGSLFLIAFFLISSAFLRLGTEAGQAIAKAKTDVMSHETADADPKTCEPTPDLRRMLTVFQDRKQVLDTREEEIRGRMQALSVADQEISRKMKELTEAEERLRDTIAMANTAAESDISKLTEVYENMKPKDAAALFEEMDPEFAAGFLGRMRPDAAAGVMAGLSPQAAYTVSVVMAGRNAEVPTE